MRVPQFNERGTAVHIQYTRTIRNKKKIVRVWLFERKEQGENKMKKGEINNIFLLTEIAKRKRSLKLDDKNRMPS